MVGLFVAEQLHDAVELSFILEVDDHAAVTFDVALHLHLGVEGLRQFLDAALEMFGHVWHSDTRPGQVESFHYSFLYQKEMNCMHEYLPFTHSIPAFSQTLNDQEPSPLDSLLLQT